jgi:UDP-glucose:O-linked fucose beta-1,3-glucosyltransferase
MLTCVQAEGDQLDGKIQKAEKEIRALENTLSKLNAKNQNLRQSFHNPDTTSADSGARMELEAKLERLLDKRRTKKAQADLLASDVTEMRQRLANMRSEEDGMRRHIKLIQGKAVQFDKERQELVAKRDRARAAVERASQVFFFFAELEYMYVGSPDAGGGCYRQLRQSRGSGEP